MFKQGDEVYVHEQSGVWIVKDADTRHDNAMMLVCPWDASGFVLMAVRKEDCQLIDPKWCKIYKKVSE
jgi:hypothetical protein